MAAARRAGTRSVVRDGRAAAADAEPEPTPRARSERDEPVAIARLVVGKTPGVIADDHVAEAGRKVLRFHLARMLDYEAGTRAGEDAEDLHKMRVATRRQRAAWRVFGEAFRDRPDAALPERPARGRRPPRRRPRPRRPARGGRRLPRATCRSPSSAPSSRCSPPGGPPRRRARAARPRARQRRLPALARRLRRLRPDGGRRRRAGRAGPAAPRPRHAPSRIWAAYESVRAYEPVLRWADVETLHDLRIAGKWLRYTLEFVREALGPGVGAAHRPGRSRSRTTSG